ncbi:extracellular solute-binding protein [Gracilibacillus sp. YIM 98692]|uniref:sugar ABC transporter substrate-binding protein n=1 Tax=Gracilibacillus sp. YIM 98692 TaxID=2663532 RepID=UPI0013D02E84|nr:extracellular solute-binding protein [Gracilibacillus sp. YIM 98692]
MFKKSILSMIFSAMLFVTLAACGPDRETEQTENNAEGEGSEKPETLTVWVNDDESQIDAYEEITARYTEETGIEVELVSFSMLDQTEAISLDGPSGNGPDLFYQPHDRLGDIYLQGLAASLELTDEQLEGYTEGALEAFTYEGELLGLPAVTETYSLLYNTNLVLEAPETMEDLIGIAEDLTNPSNDEYGFLMEANNFYFTYPFLTATGGYVFGTNEEGVVQPDDIGLASGEVVEGAKAIQSWYENEYIPEGLNADILNGLFVDGKVGVAINGPWAIPDYKEALGDKLATAPLPTKDGEPLNSFAGVKGWLVSEFTDYKQEATDLALFMTNADSSLTYFETAGELPARTDVEIDDELRASFLEQAQYAEAMPSIPEMSQVWEPMGDALNFISQGDDPKEVLEEAVAQIEEEIALQQSGQ